MVVGGLEEGFACPSPTRGLRTVVDGVEVSDGWRGVGKRLVDGWGNGCAMFELSESRADVRPWAAKGALPCATRL